MPSSSGALVARHVLEYAYTRSTGPIIGAFLRALTEGKILGVRAADGRVICPPVEYDEAGTEVHELVEVGPAGSVTSWSWTDQPRPKQPLDRPFAWALIKLDGADTSMLHVVDAGSIQEMATGMRVRARFRPDAEPGIAAIECFEVEM